MRATLSIAACALAAILWAVPLAGAAHFFANQTATQQSLTTPVPTPARLRVERDRGLLVNVWLNGRGPFVFAVDTGASLNVITKRLVAAAQLPTNRVRATEMAGLSAARIASNSEASIQQMSIGQSGNRLPSKQVALVVPSLPEGVDGILDPVQAYAPFGFSIDMPNQRIEAVDSSRVSAHPSSERDSALVSWVRKGSDDRPFVRLGDGRLALVDTGSGFGLAVNARDAVVVGGPRGRNNSESVRDIGGGAIGSRRVDPTNASIGALTLRNLPTDILYGIDRDVPVILGRDALYPFKMTFDPQRRLIHFVASAGQ